MKRALDPEEELSTAGETRGRGSLPAGSSWFQKIRNKQNDRSNRKEKREFGRPEAIYSPYLC